MKKVIFISVIILLFCFKNSFSQDFKAGISLGVNASQVDGDRMSGFFKAGFLGGLYVYRDWKSYSRFQGELLFSMKGSRSDSKSTNPDLIQVTSNNLDLRLLYIFRPFEWLHFRVGLVPSVMLDAYETSVTGREVIAAEAPAFRRFGLEYLIGITYAFNHKWSLNWNYEYSAFSIRSGNSELYDNWLYREQNFQRHNIMSFTLNYTF